jgi:hypothetical protein
MPNLSQLALLLLDQVSVVAELVTADCVTATAMVAST